ncbi:MAG: hypothetical protein AB7W16_14350 [Candidatus Obscuribacterales bacterium]
MPAEDQNSDESAPLDWRARLQHLDAGEAQSEQSFEDYVKPAEEEAPVPAKPVIPDGMSFSRSRGVKQEAPLLGLFGPKRTEEPQAGGEEAVKIETRAHAPVPAVEPPRSLQSVCQPPSTSDRAILDAIDTQTIAHSHVKRTHLIRAGVIIGLVGALAAIISMFVPFGDTGYWIRRIFLLPLPVCLALGLNEICKLIAPKNPRAARKVFGLLTFGNQQAIASLASLDIDMGDYNSAEKLLAKTVKIINRKKKPRDYIAAYSYLAAIRANTGKVAEAEKQIVTLIAMAEKYHQDRANEVNAILLATTLVHGATVADLKDDSRSALLLVGRASELLSQQQNPPAELTITALATTGYLKNLNGLYDQARPYLDRAMDIYSAMPDARMSHEIFIECNIGISCMGSGNLDEAQEHIERALSLARQPLGKRELPRVFHARAIYESIATTLDEADFSYHEAIRACEAWHPADSLQLVRILREYSDFLTGTGKAREAEKLETRFTQIKYSLDQATYESDLLDREVIKEVETPGYKKGRFPIFWLIFAGLQAFNVYSDGLRVASTTSWLLLITAVTVTIIKLRAKYGPQAEQEASAGAVLAVVSAIPFARHVVPELSVLPKRSVGMILGAALAVFGVSRLTAPPANTVPASGLMPIEYASLASVLAKKEDFSLARKAYDLAAAGAPGDPMLGATACFLPAETPPDEAVRENQKAVELEKTDPAAAAGIWKKTIEKYPGFEVPYVHLASFKEKHDKLEDAQNLIEKAIEINPNYFKSLITMSEIKQHQKDPEGANKFMGKALALMAGERIESAAELLGKPKKEESTETESASKEEDDVDDESLSETKDPSETKVPSEIKDQGEAKDRSQP